MGRKFVEHPLVVAVAMGLLAPVALPGSDDDDDLPAAVALVQGVTHAEPEPEPVSAEEFARVEDLWYQVRTRV